METGAHIEIFACKYKVMDMQVKSRSLLFRLILNKSSFLNKSDQAYSCNII